MADSNPPPAPADRASALFLREAEIRRGIELLHFGHAALTREAAPLLLEHGLGRAHHRALYFIARNAGLPVSQLLKLLGITKQSLSRVLADLVLAGFVAQAVGTHDRRQRLLTLTPEGAVLEGLLFEALKERMASAYGQAGQQAVGGFWAVLTGLIPPEDRAMVEELDRRSRTGGATAAG
jgi:DNA-binding MarR family transcriptional regulator